MLLLATVASLAILHLADYARLMYLAVQRSNFFPLQFPENPSDYGYYIHILGLLGYIMGLTGKFLFSLHGFLI